MPCSEGEVIGCQVVAQKEERDFSISASGMAAFSREFHAPSKMGGSPVIGESGVMNDLGNSQLIFDLS